MAIKDIFYIFASNIDLIINLLITKMKKLVFAVMAMFAMTFASCGNGKTSNAVTSNDSDTVVVDSTDSVNADSVVVK